MTHTQGQWKPMPQQVFNGWAVLPIMIDSPEGERVVAMALGPETEPEPVANRNLLLSAPTLLSALESLLAAQITINWDATELECLSCANRHVGDVFPLEKHDPDSACGRAAAAISKAKGEA